MIKLTVKKKRVRALMKGDLNDVCREAELMTKAVVKHLLEASGDKGAAGATAAAIMLRMDDFLKAHFSDAEYAAWVRILRDKGVGGKTDAAYGDWIDARARKPKDCDYVLAIASGSPGCGTHLLDAVEMAMYTQEDGWILEMYPEWREAKVTHWTPLPQMPMHGPRPPVGSDNEDA